MNKRIYLVFSVLGLAIGGCSGSQDSPELNGYVEAVEFYVAAPQSGWIEQLPLNEGDQVDVGDLLGQLDDESQRLLVSQADAQLEVSDQQLMDLRLGARKEELAVSQKTLDAQQAIVEEARLVFKRQKKMLADNLTSQSLYDQAKTALEVAQAQLQQAKEQLTVLHLPAREHAIEAAKSSRDAAQKALEIQRWNLSQRRITARNAGIVEQIFYRQGEFVNQGVPILSLIMPGSTKTRFYLPQNQLSDIKVGKMIAVQSDNHQPLAARISYIAQDPEFTPPVLYSNQARSKLVFLIEAILVEGNSLRPGQPVDIIL